MFSNHYWETVEQGKNFHKLNKGWAGNDVKKYKNYIRDLVTLHGASTMLDYGCGRGEQYSIPVSYPTEVAGIYTDPMTFDQYIGVDSVTQYDPCVTGIHVLPEISLKFDCVICSQVLGSIPDDDIPTVIKLLSTYATKFCFVSLIDPDFKEAKSNKVDIYNRKFFRANRTKLWYYQQFRRHYNGKNCYVFFRSGQLYHSNWIDEDTKNKSLLVLN
jgi:hypothetical protein